MHAPLRIRVTANALAVALCALPAACGHSSPHEGTRAPRWTLETTTGSKLSSRAFAGSPVYMNFFATWCVPCNDEAPGINALAKKYADRGLRVVGIDEAEDRSHAEVFARRFSLSYPVVVDDGTLEDAFNVNGLPLHVFVARDGTIAQMHAGQMNEAQIETSIRALLR